MFVNIVCNTHGPCLSSPSQSSRLSWRSRHSRCGGEEQLRHEGPHRAQAVPGPQCHSRMSLRCSASMTCRRPPTISTRRGLTCTSVMTPDVSTREWAAAHCRQDTRLEGHSCACTGTFSSIILMPWADLAFISVMCSVLTCHGCCSVFGSFILLNARKLKYFKSSLKPSS